MRKENQAALCLDSEIRFLSVVKDDGRVADESVVTDRTDWTWYSE